MNGFVCKHIMYVTQLKCHAHPVGLQTLGPCREQHIQAHGVNADFNTVLIVKLQELQQEAGHVGTVVWLVQAHKQSYCVVPGFERLMHAPRDLTHSLSEE